MYWQHFAKQSSDLLCVVDARGRYVWVNHKWRQACGRGEEEMLGHSFTEFMHPDDLMEAVETLGRIMLSTDATEDTVYEFTGRYLHADGHYLWLEWRASTPTDGKVYATARDVTERVERELEHAPWIRLLEAIEEHTGMGRWAVNLRTGEAHWSPAAMRLYGELPDTIPLDDERGSDVFHPEDADRVLSLVKESMVTGTPFEYEARIHRPDGTYRSIEVHGLVEHDESGAPVALHGLVKDMTEERVHSERMTHVERLAMIGRLAAGVAHELNNPLQFLNMNLEMLSEDFRGRATPDELESIDDALDGADRVRKIVEVLRRFGRNPSAKRERVAPEVVIDDALRLMGHSCDGVIFEREIEAGLPNILVERESIAQSIVNILTNSCQAVTAAGLGGRIIVRVSREVEDATPVVVFEIEDEGTGIDPGHLDRVFEPFFSTKAGGLGTGLGLSTTRGIIAAHGGDITLSNRVDSRGTVARFTIPNALAVPDGSVGEAVSRDALDTQVDVPPPTDVRPRRVLVVDDEAAIVGLLSRYLTRVGYEVEVAIGGHEMLSTLGSRQDWDLILCDLKMPDVDGRAVRTHILEHAPELEPKLHFMTGDSWSDENYMFLTSLGRPHLNKPFVVAELKAFLQATSGRR